MSTDKETLPDQLEMTLAMILLRLWLAMRAIQTGLEKYAGTKAYDKAVTIDGAPNDYGLVEGASSKAYAISNYNGVPAPLYEKFSDEPFIPEFALNLYDTLLGPVLILSGLALLLGLATRFSLFAMGLIYTSLTFGLILIKQDAGIAWLGTHIILVVLALILAKHNRFAILNKW